MTRKSFTLRRDTFGGGSYLQYTPSTSPASAAVASSTYLKADGVQLAAAQNILSSVSFFEGECSEYNTIELSWGVTLQEPGDLPTPYEVYIVYSPLGHPLTILEGQLLINTRVISSYTHTVQDSQWAYYTMFVRFVSNTDDDYYEPVASISVLLPNNYGSAEDLYSHIPSWYRELDEKDTGALRKFIDIFGWDIDRMRTILDYMIAMKDPQVAEVETLNNIARDLGVDLEAHELGAERLRKVLDSIGELRRQKGTQWAVDKFLTAVAASEVRYASYYNVPTILVYAQRCNLVKDPMFINGVQAGLDGGVPLSNPNLTFDVGSPGTGWDETADKWQNYGNPGTESVGDDLSSYGYDDGQLFDGGGPGDTIGDVVAGSEQKWISYPDPNTGTFENLETLGADIPVRPEDVFYFSVQQSSSLKNIQEAILTVSFYTEGGLSEGELIVSDSSPVEYNGILYWRLEIPSNGIDYSYQNAVLSLTFRPAVNGVPYSYDDFSRILLERNYQGEYFDGDSRKGGWLVDELNSISDFRWRNPVDENNSLPATCFSVYSPNYQKTKHVLERIIPQVIPVMDLTRTGVVYSNRPIGDAARYQVYYDVIPGFEPS